MTKFKIGKKVRMYGCGDGNSTFWDGDKATIVGYTSQGLLICIPDEWTDEKHQMHPKQCRLLIKKDKGKKTALKRKKNPLTGSKVSDFMRELQ